MIGDDETLAFYAAEAPRYAEWSAGHELPQEFLHFADALPDKADVLDFGCGGGWASRAFLARGHRVTALDPVPEFVTRLDQTPGIAAIHGDASALPPEPAFDAIWASFSLQHIPRAELPDTLRRICAALRPGGLLYIGVQQGSETLRDSLGRLYCHWTEADLAALLAPLGLSVTHRASEPDKGYDGRETISLHLEARKRG